MPYASVLGDAESSSSSPGDFAKIQHIEINEDGTVTVGVPASTPEPAVGRPQRFTDDTKDEGRRVERGTRKEEKKADGDKADISHRR